MPVGGPQKLNNRRQNEGESAASGKKVRIGVRIQLKGQRWRGQVSWGSKRSSGIGSGASDERRKGGD